MASNHPSVLELEQKVGMRTSSENDKRKQTRWKLTTQVKATAKAKAKAKERSPINKIKSATWNNMSLIGDERVVWMRKKLMKERGNPLWSLKEKWGHSNFWQRRNRIGIDSGIKIIRKQSEWSSAKKTKTILNECNGRRWRLMWRMFMSSTLQASVFMGKNFQNNGNSIANIKDLTLRQIFQHISEISDRTRWDLRFGNDWLVKTFMEISVIDWWRKSCKSPTHKGLRLFRFCIVPWYHLREHPMERCVERQIGMDQIIFKITETLTESTVSQWNSSGKISQDSIRCSSVKKWKVYCWDQVRHQRISQEE